MLPFEKDTARIICLLLIIAVNCLKPVSAQTAINSPNSDAEVVLLSNQSNLLPLKRLDTLSIGVLSIGTGQEEFVECLSLYYRMEERAFPSSGYKKEVKDYISWAKSLDVLIVGIFSSGSLETLPFAIHFFRAMQEEENTALISVLFGGEQQFQQLTALHAASALIYADPEAASQTAQVIFGGLGTEGKLKTDLSIRFREGHGLTVKPLNRLSYGTPKAAGMDGALLKNRIDSLVKLGLDKGAFPGCQVLVARDGQVVFHQAYGFQTYTQQRKVDLEDLYDFASISKITTGLPALMKLHDQGRFPLDVPFSRYWPDFNKNGKETITPRQALSHYAKLIPYIAYWQRTVKKNGKFKWFTFKTDSSKRFPIKIDEDLYLHRHYRKKIYKAIRKSPLLEERNYVYSGLTFLLYPKIVENLTGQPFDQYLKETFYHRLGAHSLTFNPHKQFPLSQIAPTEYDSLFRKRQIRGFVHDEAAAMMGGISGNAGLFGNANDLAKLMQMYLQMGEYGGHRYISDSTLREFTRYQYRDEGIRRGLGFDKPRLEDKENGFPAVAASEASFGHSGFTGTFTWADPETGLLLVFLSNRVHPTRKNRKVYQLDIYHQIHTAMYDALLD